MIDIEYVIHHKDSYRGGGTYGEFGGYDITLMKLGNTELTTLPSIKIQSHSIDPQGLFI